MQWLSEYVDLSGYTAQQLAEKLTRGGIEVDVVEPRNLGVSGVVVGHVVSREKHPDADKLSVCRVDAGSGELLQIVCGAKNVDSGQKVPVAMIGAVLPGNFKIKRAKLRGVESQGMICSAKELGLNDKLLAKEIQEGILVLPESAQIGDSILDVLDLNDEVLELDLTPNRADALSMRGVAYEIGALLGRKVNFPEVQAARYESSDIKPAFEQFAITISAAEDCSIYAGRVIEGVSVAASPLWLQNRLMAAGIRPINNIVDITNFVMLEYGQPLHAFDADRLAGGRVDVRRAAAGETLVTLDDAERKLEPHMLLITDGEKPIALAGVMGGANSEVSEGTTRILLESAKFAGGSVRRTSRGLGLRSEASLRFEKEVDPEGVIAALDRAAALMAEIAGGRLAPGITKAAVGDDKRLQVSVSLDKVNRYLGTALTAEEIGQIFDRLLFAYEEVKGTFVVEVPSRRGDITRDVDLIEEIARLYGYDHIPTTLVQGATTPGALSKPQFIRRALRKLLTHAGLHEAMNYSFTNPQDVGRFSRLNPEFEPIRLAMPMSEDRSVLRTSLVPQLLDIAARNRNRNIENTSVFEMGSVFIHNQKELRDLPSEEPRLGILLTGSRRPDSWAEREGAVDFYDLKGYIEKIAVQMGLPALIWEAASLPDLHPGRTAEIYIATGQGKQLLGYAGQIHPSLQAERDLVDTYVAELDLALIYEAAEFNVAYQALPKYPAITRDIAVVVDRELESAKLSAKVQEIAGDLLESVAIFDVYIGERLGDSKKSVALALVFRHAERTLKDEEVTALHEQIVKELTDSFGAELRK